MSEQLQPTPGPWSVNDDLRYEGGKPCLIWGPEGPGHGSVCEMRVHYPREFNRYDANLIAAAPDLFEACRKAVTCASLPDAVRQLCLAAVGKAAGVKV